MAKTIEELLPQLETLVGKINMAGDGDKKNFEGELASLRKEITTLTSEKATAEDRKAFVDDQIKSGVLLTKEAADAAVKEATEKVQKELEEKNRIEKVRQDRILKCIEKNINVDTEFEGMLALDGKPMTLRKRIDMIDVNETGDQQFNMDLSVWATTPTLLKDAPVIEQTPQAEAANTGKPAPAKKISLVGGTSTPASENADDGKKEEEVPRHLQGRRAISK